MSRRLTHPNQGQVLFPYRPHRFSRRRHKSAEHQVSRVRASAEDIACSHAAFMGCGLLTFVQFERGKAVLGGTMACRFFFTHTQKERESGEVIETNSDL